MPLTFKNEEDYDKNELGDEFILENIKENLLQGKPIEIINKTKAIKIPLTITLSKRQADIMAAGGLLNFTRNG
jgi:aconitate hydratase